MNGAMNGVSVLVLHNKKVNSMLPYFLTRFIAIFNMDNILWLEEIYIYILS